MAPNPEKDEDVEELLEEAMDDDCEGPSSSGSARSITQQLVREVAAAASRQNMLGDDTRDPLGDYCDQSSFNIIQFLAETETPHGSPAGAGRANHSNNLQQQQVGGQNTMNNNMAEAAAVAASRQYPGSATSSRLPDSPPTTDVSAAGSSGSPSSNSDSPYSPENYPNYPAHHNGNGIILGVNELQQAAATGAVMLDQIQMLQPPAAMQPPNARGNHQPMQQNMYMHSPYSHSAGHTQMSPLRADQHQLRATNQFNIPYTPVADVFTDMLAAGQDAGLPPDHPARKRPRSDMLEQPVYDRSRVKQDPTSMYGRYAPTPVMHASPVDGDSMYDENYMGGRQGEVIKFNKFAEESWHKLLDEHRRELLNVQVHVTADKGFVYSHLDNCFVNQKKNHFQVSVNIEVGEDTRPYFVCVNNALHRIEKMMVEFVGVKSEMPTSEIQVKQSQTDRRPAPHEPVELPDLPPRQLTKVTVPRLHFSETTMNNQRKNSRPNPDQKYFLLVVRLYACTEGGLQHLFQSFASERVIVRATNPGQFEPPESEISWLKNNQLMFTHGAVGIGTERPIAPGAMLSVAGDIYHAGGIVTPSDKRLKENINDVDPRDALDRLHRYRIVNYAYKKELADEWNLSEQARNKMGVIAQELREVHPEAVKEEGDFLAVDDSRIFYDNVVVTQELSKMQTDIETRMGGQVTNMQKQLGKIFKRKEDDPDKKRKEGGEGTTVADEKAVDGDDKDSGLGETQRRLGASRYSLSSSFMREVAKHRLENQMCSTRLTQGTIVTLVLVMAICLLSMSGLYVLDWHNRNYGVHNIVPPTQPPVGTSTEELGLLRRTFIVPDSQPDAPPLFALCTHKLCQSFCCSERSVYQSEKKHGGFNPDTVVPLAGSKAAFLAAIAGAPDMSPKAFFPRALQNGVKFEVLNLNMTIDERYCSERSCDYKKRHYTLYIPISPYMPTTNVQLKVTVPEGMVANSCGRVAEFDLLHCDMSAEPYKSDRNRSPRMWPVDTDIFEVTAGQFRRSAYRFRISYSTESCFAYEDEYVNTYDEYDLIFYRACDHHVHHTPSPMYPTDDEEAEEEAT